MVIQHRHVVTDGVQAQISLPWTLFWYVHGPCIELNLDERAALPHHVLQCHELSGPREHLMGWLDLGQEEQRAGSLCWSLWTNPSWRFTPQHSLSAAITTPRYSAQGLQARKEPLIKHDWWLACYAPACDTRGIVNSKRQKDVRHVSHY